MRRQTSQKAELFARALRTIVLGVFAVFVCAFILTEVVTEKTSAAVSNYLNFQARLETSAGAVAADGNYNVEFKIYSASTSSGSSQGSCTGDASCLWTETRTGANQVHVSNGYLTVNLGSVTTFPSTINWNQQLWISMNIGGTGGSPSWDGEMSPRLQLTAVPYAWQAGALGNGSYSAVFNSSGNLQFQQASIINALTAASGTQLTLQGGAASSGTNVGGTLLLQGGAGASTGASGSVIVQSNTNNSATAFQVQNASGAGLLTADTTNTKILVGQGNFDVLGLGTPTGTAVVAGSNQGGSLSGASGTTYYYKVSAINAVGETFASSEVSINGASFTPLTVPGAATLALTTGTALGVGNYQYEVTFVTANGETTGGTAASITTTSGNQAVNLTAIPTGPTGTTSRKIYRTAVGGSTYGLLTTLGDNTTTTYGDTTADGSLGAAIPVSNTATTNTNNASLTWTAVVGATSYHIYRGTTAGRESVYFSSATNSYTDTGAAGTTGSIVTSDSTARVGIGTSSPTANLTVVGTTVLQTPVNSTTAFQIQNASGNALFNADTSNMRLGVNVTYAQMSSPGTLTLSLISGSSTFGTGTTYMYVVTAVDGAGGETTGTDEASIATNGTGQSVQISWTPITGAVKYNIYRTASNGASGSETLYATTQSATYIDTAGYSFVGTTSNGYAPSGIGMPSSNTAYVATNVSNQRLQLSIGGNGSPAGQLYVSGVVPSGPVSSINASQVTAAAIDGSYLYGASTGSCFTYGIANPNTMGRDVDMYGLGFYPTACSPGSGTTTVPGLQVVSGHYGVSVTGDSKLTVKDIQANTAGTSVSTTGVPTDVAVQGEYMYVVTNENTIRIFESATTSAAPTQLGSYNIGSSDTPRIAVQGQYAYVLSPTNATLTVINIATPSSPSKKQQITSLSTNSDSIFVQNGYAYVGSDSSFDIYDVAGSYTKVGTAAVPSAPNNIHSVYVQGRYAYVALNSGALGVYDVSNPAKPTLVGTTPTSLSNSKVVLVQGRYAFVFSSGSGSAGTLDVFDIGGSYMQQLEAGGVNTGTLQVMSDANVSGNQSIQGGLNIGRAANISGDVSAVNGNFTVTTDQMLLRSNNNLWNLPQATLTQSGSYGDASLKFANTFQSQSWSIGLDTNNGGAFEVSSSTSAGSGSTVQLGATNTSNGSDTSDANEISCSQFSTTNGGTATSMSLMTQVLDGTSMSYSMALYDNSSPKNLLASTSTGTLSASPAWNTLSLSYTLVAGTTYWLCANTNGAATQWGTTSSVFVNKYKVATTFGSWPASMPTGGTSTSSTNALSFYVTYTSPHQFANPLLTIGQHGETSFQSTSSNTAAFQIQNASAASMFNVVTSSTTNKITNGDFENGDGTTGWSVKGGTSPTMSASTSSAWQGTRGLLIGTNSVAGAGAQYNYTFAISTTYTLSFYAATSSGVLSDLNVGRQETGVDKDISVSNGDASNCTGLSLSTSWTRIVCTFTTAGSLSGTNNIYVKVTGTAAENFLIDGVQLQTGTAATAFDPGGKLQLDGFVNSPVIIQNAFNSTAAFQALNASGVALLTVDTANTRVTIGAGVAGETSPTLLVVDSQTGSAGDPTEVDGGIYYNATTMTYRCGRDGLWQNCGTNPIDRGYTLEDEFMGGTTTTGLIGSLGWSFTTIGTVDTFQYNGGSPGTSADHPGVFVMSTPTTGSPRGSVLLLNGGGSGSLNLAAGQVMRASAAFSSNSATTGQVLRVGITAQATSAARSSSGVWWEYDPSVSTTAWSYCVGTGTGVLCSQDANVTAATLTFVRLAIVIKATGASASSVDFYINGFKHSVTFTTVDTTTKVNPTIACTGLSTTSDSCTIDYYQLQGVASAAR